jgi:hypothetical protein
MSPVPRDRGVLVGLMGLEDDARVDFARLRAERRAKVFSCMESHDLDALILAASATCVTRRVPANSEEPVCFRSLRSPWW